MIQKKIIFFKKKSDIIFVVTKKNKKIIKNKDKKKAKKNELFIKTKNLLCKEQYFFLPKYILINPINNKKNIKNKHKVLI